MIIRLFALAFLITWLGFYIAFCRDARREHKFWFISFSYLGEAWRAFFAAASLFGISTIMGLVAYFAVHGELVLK